MRKIILFLLFAAPLAAQINNPPNGSIITPIVWDMGGAVYNVKAYGAKGDGSTNDCTAITNANAARESGGGGILLFPTGQYVVGSSCHITIAQSGTIQGAGPCGAAGGSIGVTYAQCATTIQSSDTTGYLFTVTALNILFTNLGIANTATATAGAGVYVNGSNYHQRVSYSSMSVQGFYDDIDQVNGSLWGMNSVYLGPAVRYDIWIHDQTTEDAGNWTIANSFINVQNATAVAGIYITGAGGGTIASNAIQGNPSVIGGQYGIYLNCSSCGTSTLYMVNNNVTEFGDSAFYAPNAWNGIVSTGNAWWSNAGTHSPFYCGTGCTALALTGGSIYAPASNVAPITVTEANNTGWVGEFAPASGPQAPNAIAATGTIRDTTIWPNIFVNAAASAPTFAGIQSGVNAGTGYYFNTASSNDWIFGSNTYYNGSSWTAKLATASSMENAAGAIRFRVDTGLTPGGTYSPTVKFTINSDGTVQPGGAYKSSDGTSGFTGTCASTTTLTVKSGIITGCA